jgi:hypothetical protein
MAILFDWALTALFSQHQATVSSSDTAEERIKQL